jgi:hypothetical protein
MPTIDQILADPALASAAIADPIRACADGQFRWGQLQARLYTPHSPDFPQPFLYSLYERARVSGQRHPRPLDLAAGTGLGSLPLLFCGMTNLGPDAICAYLSQRAVCVVGEWREGEGSLRAFAKDTAEEAGTVGEPSETEGCDIFYVSRSATAASPASLTDPTRYRYEFAPGPAYFHPLGFCFPSTPPMISPRSLTGQPSNSVFAGYTIFSEAWRTPAATVLMYLGLAWLFSTFSLAALHGSRLPANHLTRRWTHRFGFRDCGELPACMPDAGDPTGPLASGVISSLARGDFEARLRGVFEAERAAVPVDPILSLKS